MANEPTSTRFRPEISRRPPEIPGVPRAVGEAEQPPETEKQLFVGRDIVLNGKIAACDKSIRSASDIMFTLKRYLETSRFDYP